MNKSQAVVHDDRYGIDCCWTKEVFRGRWSTSGAISNTD